VLADGGETASSGAVGGVGVSPTDEITEELAHVLPPGEVAGAIQVLTPIAGRIQS